MGLTLAELAHVVLQHHPKTEEAQVINRPSEFNMRRYKGMTIVKDKCAMIGCEELSYQPLTVAPGTVLTLCLKHFIEEGGGVEEEVNQAGPQDPS